LFKYHKKIVTLLFKLRDSLFSGLLKWNGIVFKKYMLKKHLLWSTIIGFKKIPIKEIHAIVKVSVCKGLIPFYSLPVITKSNDI